MAEILLFEDSPSLRRIVTRYLRDAGHGVSAFEDGAASRDRAVLERVDVVVTDLSMPGTDGRKALHNVSVLRPDLPAILMTGVERFADPVLDTAYGYLHKPFPEEALLEMIDAALHASGGGRGGAMPVPVQPPCDAGRMAPVSFCAPLPPVSPLERIRARAARWLSRNSDDHDG